MVWLGLMGRGRFKSVITDVITGQYFQTSTM